MSFADIVDSCSNELGALNAIAIKEESDLLQECQTILQPCQKSNIDYRRRDCQETRSPNGPSTGQSSTSVLDRQISSIDDNTISSNLSISAAPICRQFWKAGSYEEGIASKSTIQNSGSYLHIHPRFLHSNATSHKWVFGALAELLDNAIDEIQNGATFVIIDKTTNARDGRPALLIHDDGSGMDPEGMRRCLSFGFSDKKSNSAIGRYGNGFKTSSMRLGADAIVFSRHVKDGKLTQSIGLLSYTFLTRTGHNRIIVPMVDYELNQATGKLEMLNQCDEESFTSNLSILLEWSPYTTLEELLKQFDDIGYHGTKVIVYNLWCDDQGIYELDFDTDPEDIRLKEATKVAEKSSIRSTNEQQHIANQLRYSLRVYLSILYLKLPQSFSIMLRGRVVLYHNIAIDLKYPEFIMYKPAGSSEGILTSIGFLKEAPQVNIHGFNVYHKNRLILPFWHVVSFSDSRGRGVVGVLEANFIEPTHNKQDFEKTAVFQKLEQRLKEMTWEYWDHHCRLLGYKQSLKKPRVPLLVPTHNTSHKGRIEPVVLNSSFISPTTRAVPSEPQLKRKESSQLAELERLKRRAGEAVNGIDTRNFHQAVRSTRNAMDDDEEARKNKKLRAQCMEYEKNEEELNLKVTELRSTLDDLEHEYARMLAELQLLEKPKEEKECNCFIIWHMINWFLISSYPIRENNDYSFKVQLPHAVSLDNTDTSVVSRKDNMGCTCG